MLSLVAVSFTLNIRIQLSVICLSAQISKILPQVDRVIKEAL